MQSILEVCEILDPSVSGTALTLILPFAERQKSRMRTSTACGRTLGLFLERGRLLADGDLLRAVDGTLIRVQAADEALSEARSSDPQLLLRAAYHLGNRHVPLQIESGRLRWQHDHVLDVMVGQLGLKVTAIMAPFHPENGAYHGGESRHGEELHGH